MDFFITCNRELILAASVLIVFMLMIVLLFLDRRAVYAISPIFLIFIVSSTFFAFKPINIVTSSLDDYFKSVYMSKNFVEDRSNITNKFYHIDGGDIFKNNNMSVIIVSPYQLEIDIDNINKDYLSNKKKSDPDLNICDSIANSAKKYDGIIENPSSCLSNGRIKIFFDMRNRSQQFQYQNDYTGQQPMQQQNGYYAPQMQQQVMPNGYAGQQPMQQQNGYYAPQMQQQVMPNGYAGQQPMQQQNGYYAPQVKSGSSVN